ncbi:MAG: HAD family hydrolase [Anaerorhabdus sp.]|uniref:HAD family hydrolase n=1 Tax=Anaerorhabdus sp. TaxID=1872524 RepID=UPI003A8C2A09
MKAVFFDMDGVLINSEIFYMNGTFEWMKELGFKGTFEDICTIIGTTLDKTYDMLYDMLEGKYPRERIIQENDVYFEKHPLDYKNISKEGAIETFKALKDAGYKIAICSSSPLDNIKHVAEVCGFEPYLDFVVSGEQFVQSKPHPEIYLHAAEVLNVTPEECVVVEDSEFGIQAGISAGMIVLALEDKRLPNNQAKATQIINSLSEVQELVEKYSKKC